MTRAHLPPARRAWLALGVAFLPSCSLLFDWDRYAGNAQPILGDGSTAEEASPDATDGEAAEADAARQGPEVIATLDNPGPIAVDDAGVFVADLNAGSIVRIDKSDAGVSTIASGQAPTAIALDADYVYWNSGWFVRRAPKGGGTATDVVHEEEGSSDYAPRSLVVDGPYLYYTIAMGFASCPVAGSTCLRGQSAWILSYGAAMGTIAVYPGIPFLFGTSTNGTIYRSLQTRGLNDPIPSADPIAIDQANPTDIACDAVDIYWSNHDSAKGALMTVPITPQDDVGPRVLVGGVDPTAIAIDKKVVFWLDLSQGAVLACAKVGCAQPTVVAPMNEPAGARDIAIDDAYVYWTNAGTSEVLRAPKP